MYLHPTDEQLQIADAVADMIAAEAPFDRWFIADTDMLDEENRLLNFGAQMGWSGFAAPASAGGSEASIVDEMLVFRELGARLAPIGFTSVALAIPLALAKSDDSLAGGLVSGAVRVALAAGPEGSVLLGAAGARFALVAGPTTVGLHEISGDLDVSLAGDGLTSTAKWAGPRGQPGLVGGGAALARYFRLLVAAQLQGVARTAVAQSNAYAKEREQFGRPIGSFQAVRHRIADMELASRKAEAALYYAAVSMRDDRQDANFQLLSALVLADAAAVGNAQMNIANHGAIGVTVENIGHLLLKRAILWRAAIGGWGELLEELAEEGAPFI